MSMKVCGVVSLFLGLSAWFIAGILGFVSCDPRTINSDGYAVLGWMVGSIGVVCLTIGLMLPSIWED